MITGKGKQVLPVFKSWFHHYFRQGKNGLFSALKANTGIRVLSLIIGLCLWLLVIGSRREHASKEVPFSVTVPEGFMVSSEVPPTVSFNLHGPKFFLRTLLARNEKPIEIDLREQVEGRKTTQRILKRLFPEQFEAPAGVEVQDVLPPSLSFTVEKVHKVKVPVRLSLVTNGAASIQPELVSRINTDPKLITVTGPMSTVMKLKEVHTKPVELKAVLRSLVGTTVELEEKHGVMKLSPMTVKVFLDSPVPRTKKINANQVGKYPKKMLQEPQ